MLVTHVGSCKVRLDDTIVQTHHRDPCTMSAGTVCPNPYAVVLSHFVMTCSSCSILDGTYLHLHWDWLSLDYFVRLSRNGVTYLTKGRSCTDVKKIQSCQPDRGGSETRFSVHAVAMFVSGGVSVMFYTNRL